MTSPGRPGPVLRAARGGLSRRRVQTTVIGSALQVIVQLPVVLRLLRGLHLSFAFHLENVRTVVRNFFPVFVSRGVVQISAYVDALLASLLPTGAVAALFNSSFRRHDNDGTTDPADQIRRLPRACLL